MTGIDALAFVLVRPSSAETDISMTRFSLSLALMLALVVSAWAEDARAPIDLLAFSNGGLFERATSAYGGSWIGLWLLDEEPSTGWTNALGVKPPFEVVVSVPERSRFERFVFDTASAENPERSAQDIDILVSDQSATEHAPRRGGEELLGKRGHRGRASRVGGVRPGQAGGVERHLAGAGAKQARGDHPRVGTEACIPGGSRALGRSQPQS